MTAVSTSVKLWVDAPESDDLLQAEKIRLQQKTEDIIIEDVRMFILFFVYYYS
jgi:hypothetical protein